MPKEVIHDDSARGDNSTPFAVEVKWGRDTFVQLASINLSEDDKLEEFEPEAGWYVDLDRAMINKLIKSLRRARDQAYGADE